jgi:hypothetical protein
MWQRIWRWLATRIYPHIEADLIAKERERRRQMREIVRLAERVRDK